MRITYGKKFPIQPPWPIWLKRGWCNNVAIHRAIEEATCAGLNELETWRLIAERLAVQNETLERLLVRMSRMPLLVDSIPTSEGDHTAEVKMK